MMDGYRTLARVGLVGALVGIEIYLARDLTAGGNVVGYTATREFSLAPPRAAKVRTVDVQLGARVVAGQLIAELDTTEIDNALDGARAERARAAAAIDALSAKLHREGVDIERRFASSAEKAQADLATADAAARTAAAELAAVEIAVKQQQELVEKRLADATTLNALSLRRAALAKQVDAAEQVLGVLRGNVSAAAKRTEGFSAAGDGDLAPLEASVRAAELKVAQLETERVAMTLRAPADGVIEQLPLHAGDLAAPGAPVAVVVVADTGRVVACVPEARTSGLEPGQEVETTSAYDHETSTGEIESLTGEIAPLPPRCQPPGSKAIALGRVAVIALDQPARGLPGQTQMISIHARRRPRKSGPPVPAPAPVGEAPVVDMKVPPALLARSRFEPSGLVWISALDRYLIVSDDTGLATRDEHPPWLFTMTADGAVDPSPMVVGGVAELNDLESIAAEGDLIYVMSSQSVSKKGKRPSSRQHLARLALQGGELRAEAVVDVADMLDKAPAVARALGVADTRRLDIEGMAARGGALYLGLKAPVDGDDRAAIWRVGHPEKLLAGDAAGAELSIWATVKLSVQADGRDVPGGVCDLIFVDDRTLAIGATASGMDPREQTGALYVARAGAGVLAAHRVRTFPGLKPEGLALAPRGGLVVAFDRGAQTAQWLTLPLAEARAN